MPMSNNKRLLLVVACLTILLLFVASEPIAAQQNPTPVVIVLTPADSPTDVPGPTSVAAFPSDRFEPNDVPEMATLIGWQTEAGLTLVGTDVDYFTAYLKAGQTVRLETMVEDGLDTRVKLFWEGQLVAENDDRSLIDVGSSVMWTTASDGWLIALVEKVTSSDGRYSLSAALVAPAATSTPPPTLTPAPTSTPMPTPTPVVKADLAEPNDTPESAYPITPGVRATYTLGPADVDYFRFIAKAGNTYRCETETGQVDTLLTVIANGEMIAANDDQGVGRVDSYLSWTAAVEQSVLVRVEARGGGFGQYDLICQAAAPASPAGASASFPAASATTVALAATAPLTATTPISLTVRHIGRIQAPSEGVTSRIRLLIYYDANNDRSPGPGEGVANVSVLAVDAQGQRLARVFTNAQGEAVFNLSSDAVTRIVVPFVPGWSARVRVGEVNEGIVLGLPAVRLPVFLPVVHRLAGKE